jgi:hypothetical protein
VLLTRLKAWGSSNLQRFAWNREFAEGHWDFISIWTCETAKDLAQHCSLQFGNERMRTKVVEHDGVTYL